MKTMFNLTAIKVINERETLKVLNKLEKDNYDTTGIRINDIKNYSKMFVVTEIINNRKRAFISDKSFYTTEGYTTYVTFNMNIVKIDIDSFLGLTENELTESIKLNLI